jgi:hypothetical protein
MEIWATRIPYREQTRGRITIIGFCNGSSYFMRYAKFQRSIVRWPTLTRGYHMIAKYDLAWERVSPKGCAIETWSCCDLPPNRGLSVLHQNVPGVHVSAQKVKAGPIGTVFPPKAGSLKPALVVASDSCGAIGMWQRSIFDPIGPF